MVFYMCFTDFTVNLHFHAGGLEIMRSAEVICSYIMKGFDMTKTVLLFYAAYKQRKTTIGKLLSERLGLPFYDTDQMLIEHYQMTIRKSLPKAAKHFSAIMNTRSPAGYAHWSIRRLHRRRHADL